jgi:hypothetical protein
LRLRLRRVRVLALDPTYGELRRLEGEPNILFFSESSSQR